MVRQPGLKGDGGPAMEGGRRGRDQIEARARHTGPVYRAMQGRQLRADDGGTYRRRRDGVGQGGGRAAVDGGSAAGELLAESRRRRAGREAAVDGGRTGR